MFDKRFFVNEEKKIVVCKLEYCSNALICDMCHEGLPGHEMLLIDDMFVGKAKCSDEDTFDVEIGKQIAYKRAIDKLVRAKKRTLLNFTKENQMIMDFINKKCNKLSDRYDNIINRKDQDIEKILG